MLLDQDIQLSYWDYQFRLDRRLGPVEFTLLAFGSHDMLVPGQSDAAREVDIDFHRVSLRAGVPVLGGRLQGSIALGSDHTRAPILDVYPIMIDALSAAPRLSYGRSFGPTDVAVGFDGDITRYDPVVLGTLQAHDSSDLGQRRLATLLAGYTSATIRPHRRLEITPEVRFDSYQVGEAEDQTLAPRISARVGLRKDTTLKVGGGRFSQLPSLPLQIPGADGFGLRLLGLQSSWQASLGLETSRSWVLRSPPPRTITATYLPISGIRRPASLILLRTIS